MPQTYLPFVKDDHLIGCIAKLHEAYLSARDNVSKNKLYRNKVDVFKLTFDAKFKDLSEKEIIDNEVFRQIDKSVNNAIGTFHEQLLGGIDGYEVGNMSGYDLKAVDDTLFADIKNKHNTMNSSAAESLFQKLARYADDYKKAKCYWVQVLATKSFHENWVGDINGKEYSHSRVFKISGDQFYALLTGVPDALYQVYQVLPRAIDDYLASIASTHHASVSALDEISKAAAEYQRGILNQIASDNFPYYKGFDSL